MTWKALLCGLMAWTLHVLGVSQGLDNWSIVYGAGIIFLVVVLP